MNNFETLAAAASELTGPVKDNVLALISEMSTPIEGIGDDPIPWRPSYLRLVQGTTDRGSIPKGSAIGDFVIGERKIEQPFEFIPIKSWDARQYWDPDQTNNKMLCWSPDAKLGQIGVECRACPHQVWVEGEGSACGKIKAVMAISRDLSTVFTIQFAKSNFKVGTELENAMKKAGVAPYLRVYGLTSATSSTAKNVENYKLQILDDKLRRTEEDKIPFLKELFTQISTDRKATLEIFYKNVAAKREAQLALASSTAEAPAALPAPAASADTEVEIAVEKPKVEATSLAKGYKV